MQVGCDLNFTCCSAGWRLCLLAHSACWVDCNSECHGSSNKGIAAVYHAVHAIGLVCSITTHKLKRMTKHHIASLHRCVINCVNFKTVLKTMLDR